MSARTTATAGDDSARSDREIARELFGEFATLTEDDARRQRVRGGERGRAGLAVFQRDGGGVLFGCGVFCGQGDRLSRDQRAQP